MVFSSLEFIFLFLPITLLFYFSVPFKYKNLVLLITSLGFYGWGEPVYIFLMMFTILVDYIAGYYVAKYLDTDKKKSRNVMILAIIINLGMLGFFKYYDFIAVNLASIEALSFIKPLNIALPIGISFYTFQALSYVIDVYRRDGQMQKNIVSFGAYVTVFPQLIAGPIVRYADVDDQLRSRDHSTAKIASGIRTFVAGLCKKILFANAAGMLWDHFRTIPQDEKTVVGVWLGIIFYAFQIYFDFSAYSDMAIGLGKIIGFRFLENFNYPYVAQSITDFWRRWHISLSTWFLEYVYIPLGGNRVGKFKLFRNIAVVWLLTGLWHGASWNYILWGAYYCAILMIEKVVLLNVLKKTPMFVKRIYTIFLIIIGWLIFVFEDLSAGMVYLSQMFGVGTSGFIDASTLYELIRNLIFIIILCIAATPAPRKLFYKLFEKSNAFRITTAVASIFLVLLCIAYLVNSSYNPFLYFRF